MKKRSPKYVQRLTRFTFSSRHSLVVTAEVILGIGMCFLSLLIFVYFSREVLESDFSSIDGIISMFVFSLRSPALTQFMLLVSSFGEGGTMLLATLVSIVLLIKKHRKEAVLFCLTLIIGLVLNTTFKLMVQRPRPQMFPLAIENSYSFPSGHAMNSFIFYALISYVSFHFFRNKTLTFVTTIISITLVLLIGFSRIYLGVHYFTDVLAGYIAGFWWFITVLLIEHTLIFYKLFRTNE